MVMVRLDHVFHFTYRGFILMVVFHKYPSRLGHIFFKKFVGVSFNKPIDYFLIVIRWLFNIHVQESLEKAISSSFPVSIVVHSIFFPKLQFVRTE